VTWVGPVPAQARVAYTDGAVFRAVNAVTGPEVPREFPQKYLRGLQRVELYNASMSWDTQALTGWEKRHGIAMETEPLSIFDDYVKAGYVIFSTLVEHPLVPDPRVYASCSVVLQRGVIVYANGNEDLYLRSYFHSAKDGENYVNFVPKGGVRISFESDGVWFPLELTRVIQEPHSYVVLDILTPKPFDVGKLPTSFRAGRRGVVTLGGARYNVVRISATLSAKERSPDLKLGPE